MRTHIRFGVLLLGLLTTQFFWAQQTYKVHSHNDYLQDVPFWHAYGNGAASIEVDLFLKRDSLFVTHSQGEIQSGRTLESLYLDRLVEVLEQGQDRELQLLIDLKSEAHATLDKLVATLGNYPSLTSSDKLNFVVSGNRPLARNYGNYPDFIKFDHQNLEDLDQINLEKVALVSVNFKGYSVWNGYGRMMAPELQAVEKAIAKAKASGKPFRFWATPDTKTGWARMAQLGVDYINTDRPAAANAYLGSLDRNIYSQERPIAVYRPKFGYRKGSTPRNVVLMIGDGNGLAQISAAMIANRGELSITQLKHIGLIKTSSDDDLITDSAAAATALATGVKTNNRAIGQGPGGEDLNTLVEEVAKHGFNTALVGTDAIYGATPASFYANRMERDDTQGLVTDLLSSDLGFFIAGGRDQEPRIRGTFATKSLDDFKDLGERTAVYLGDTKAPSMKNGREDLLPRAVKKALDVLGAEKAPFFLMVEGAQIDNGGHSNDTEGIVREMLDFDRAIAEAVRFADAHGNTLVVVTADHETSGFGIVGGNQDKGVVHGDFLTVDHSGIMVPVFAYGPQGERFNGIYENSDIFLKILEALDLR